MKNVEDSGNSPNILRTQQRWGSTATWKQQKSAQRDTYGHTRHSIEHRRELTEKQPEGRHKGPKCIILVTDRRWALPGKSSQCEASTLRRNKHSRVASSCPAGTGMTPRRMSPTVTLSAGSSQWTSTTSVGTIVCLTTAGGCSADAARCHGCRRAFFIIYFQF